MDISVVAAVGSFAVSERILKPKATVLIILGCVLIYDLTTKTHDVSSLRVYRGPALLAFTLMMSAYSLRTWRRNGVACDELLFLPGTPHGQTHGVDGVPIVEDAPSGNNPVNEGDAAGGLAPIVERRRRTHSEELLPLNNPMSDPTTRTISSDPLAGGGIEDENDDGDDDFETWEDEEDDLEDEEESDEGSEEHMPSPNALCQRRTARGSESDNEESQQLQPPQTNLQRFQENHPRIVRIGTFFFFRSSSSSTQNATYAPSGPAVFGAALDLSMPILFNFHLFIEAFNHIATDPSSETTAKILPLIFLSVLMVRTVIPPGKRRRFWSTVKFVALAPFHKVRFRDAFIGDVVTSLVRPIQDVLFALSYYGTVVYGTVIGSYGLSEAGRILEKSWFLHNLVLPLCALIPLWWKFLQTLRQAYDAKRRWPHYGNSFKYLSAGLVIIYAMTHREEGRSPWWIVAFISCTIYQVIWDTLVDWELFVVVPKAEQSESPCFSRISSMRPSSTILLWLHMRSTQPLAEALRRIPSFDQIKLRSKRLYKKESFYYRCFILNTLLRFTWMLCFIPAYRLTKDDEEEATFSSDVNSYVGVLLPVAEILRRCHWGFLKVETETLRLMDNDILYTQVDEMADGYEMEERGEGLGHESKPSALIQIMPTWLDVQQKSQPSTSSGRSFQFSDSFMQRLFFAELVLWAVAFVCLGYYATC